MAIQFPLAYKITNNEVIELTPPTGMTLLLRVLGVIGVEVVEGESTDTPLTIRDEVLEKISTNGTFNGNFISPNTQQSTYLKPNGSNKLFFYNGSALRNPNHDGSDIVIDLVVNYIED